MVHSIKKMFIHTFCPQLPLNSSDVKIQCTCCCLYNCVCELVRVWFGKNHQLIPAHLPVHHHNPEIPLYTTGTTYIMLLNQLLPSWQTHWLRLSLLSGAEKAVNLRFTQRKEGRGEAGGSHSNALLQRRLQISDGAHRRPNLPPGKKCPVQYSLHV